MELFFKINSDKNIHQLSRHTRMSPRHISVVTDIWETEGLIKKIKVGRETDFQLTEKGKEFEKLLRACEALNLKKYKEVENETK